MTFVSIWESSVLQLQKLYAWVIYLKERRFPIWLTGGYTICIGTLLWTMLIILNFVITPFNWSLILFAFRQLSPVNTLEQQIKDDKLFMLTDVIHFYHLELLVCSLLSHREQSLYGWSGAFDLRESKDALRGKTRRYLLSNISAYRIYLFWCKEEIIDDVSHTFYF